MRADTPAILLALREHGEHGAIVRLMTPAAGLVAAYVSGARGRRLRPLLLPGNRLAATLSARTERQLPQATVELTHSLAPIFSEPLAAAAIDWVTALTATVLPEHQPYPALYSALDGLLAAIEAAPVASGWGAALVRYELLLLAELGFGLDLSACAVTGDTATLTAVSPRSGRAVSAAIAADHDGKLLPLPAFLTGGGPALWPDILAGMGLTGHFVRRDLLPDRAHALIETRARLVERMARAA